MELKLTITNESGEEHTVEGDGVSAFVIKQDTRLGFDNVSSLTWGAMNSKLLSAKICEMLKDENKSNEAMFWEAVIADVIAEVIFGVKDNARILTEDEVFARKAILEAREAEEHGG